MTERTEITPGAPARRRTLLALAAVCAAVVLGFTALLTLTLRLPRRFSPAGCETRPPENFLYDLTWRQEDGRIVLQGWACVREDRFKNVDIRAVVRTADGAYYTLPTVLREDETAKSAIGGVPFGEYGGFTAFLAGRLARQPVTCYILYRCNGYDLLVDTGVSVP